MEKTTEKTGDVIIRIVSNNFWDLVRALATKDMEEVEDIVETLLLAHAVEASCYGMEIEANNFLRTYTRIRGGLCDDQFVLNVGEMLRDEMVEMLYQEGMLES